MDTEVQLKARIAELERELADAKQQFSVRDLVRLEAAVAKYDRARDLLAQAETVLVTEFAVFAQRLAESGIRVRPRVHMYPPHGPVLAADAYVFCEHANECPTACPCDADCVCKAGTCSK